MDFWDLSKLLLRRWYVVLPTVLLAALATVWIGLTVKPDYTATTHLRLVPPHRVSVGNVSRDPANPYLDLGLGSLSELARVSLTGESVATALIAAGYSDTFTITVDQSSPLVTIEAVGPTEQQAIGTTGQLATLFRQSVLDFQTEQGVGPDDLILVDRLLVGDKVAVNTMKVTRAVIAVGAFGLLLSVGLTVVFDAVAGRRRPRVFQPVSGPPGTDPGRAAPGRVGSGRAISGLVGTRGAAARGSGLGGGPGYGAVPPQAPVFTIDGGFAPALGSGRAFAGESDDDNPANVTLAGVGRVGIELSGGGVRVDPPGTGRGVSIEYRAGARPSANAEVAPDGARAELARRDGAPEQAEPKTRPTEDESTILLPLSFKSRPHRDGGSVPR